MNETVNAVADDRPHILVVDDDTRLRALLRRYLSENGFFVTTAGDAGEARACLQSFEVDVIILDIMMPGESGLDLTRDLRRSRDIPIILLTARGEAENRIAGLEAGADDYLGKPFEPRELLLRLGTILRRTAKAGSGSTPVQTSVQVGSFVLPADRDELVNGTVSIRLTPSEASVLRTLATSPGAAVDRETLVERARINGGVRAVDVLVTRLRRKIETDQRDPRLLLTVRGEGYLLRNNG